VDDVPSGKEKKEKKKGTDRFHPRRRREKKKKKKKKKEEKKRLLHSLHLGQVHGALVNKHKLPIVVVPSNPTSVCRYFGDVPFDIPDIPDGQKYTGRTEARTKTSHKISDIVANESGREREREKERDCAFPEG
jgi:hypothetical protein